MSESVKSRARATGTPRPATCNKQKKARSTVSATTYFLIIPKSKANKITCIFEIRQI